MRVLLDAHQLGRRQTGNETYVRELLGALRDRPGIDVVAAVEGRPDAVDELAPPVRMRRVPRGGVARLAVMPLLARMVAADVVHAIYFLPPALGRPSVVTIHDISFERHPEFFGRRALVRDRVLIRDAARRASRIVTVSETSRRDLTELWGVPPERVVVVYNGVDRAFSPAATPPAAGSLDPVRVLAVGTLQPRKNLGRLLDALAIVARRRRVLLRVVGPDGFQAGVIRDRLASTAPGVGVEVLGYVDRPQLVEEYRSADLLAYPSLYEGFGLPVVEAMACGTPVMTTTGGSLPEIAGDAALVVDPLDTTALAEAVSRLADDGALRARLRDRGLIRARDFSWDTVGRLHADLYRTLAG